MLKSQLKGINIYLNLKNSPSTTFLCENLSMKRNFKVKYDKNLENFILPMSSAASVTTRQAHSRSWEANQTFPVVFYVAAI